jgi:hypothetical protein
MVIDMQTDIGKTKGTEGKTWEFVVHRFASPTRWTWSQVAMSGRVIQKSPVSHSSLAEAVTDATFRGFDAFKDYYQVIELD